jgi:hypothetical protein
MVLHGIAVLCAMTMRKIILHFLQIAGHGILIAQIVNANGFMTNNLLIAIAVVAIFIIVEDKERI